MEPSGTALPRSTSSRTPLRSASQLDAFEPSTAASGGSAVLGVAVAERQRAALSVGASSGRRVATVTGCPPASWTVPEGSSTGTGSPASSVTVVAARVIRTEKVRPRQWTADRVTPVSCGPRRTPVPTPAGGRRGSRCR
jgi:hypothetical protein